MPSNYTVVAAELSHETNTFSVVRTDMVAFERVGLRRGQEIRAALRESATSFAGFFDGAEKHAFLLVPVLAVWATPSGIVDGPALESLTAEIVSSVRSTRPDGVLLALHGAMVSEVAEDADGWVLEQVREAVGPDVPIVATLDLHANISERMVDAADLLIGYDTYPHIDQRERALEAADALVEILEGRWRPTSSLVKPPMMPTSQNMPTAQEPMRTLLRAAHEIEQRSGVINVTVAGGFPPANTADTGFGVVVTTNHDPSLARNLAMDLARTAWEHRQGFLGGVASWDDAAHALREHRQGPLVLVDIGDNPWTGGPGDSVELVRFLIQERVANACVASVADPGVVARCVEAGPGATVDLCLGGHTDTLHGPPLQTRAYIKVISDGRYRNLGPMHAEVEVRLGPSALVVVEGIEVVVTTFAETPIDLNVFRSFGVEPTERGVIGLKGKGHFRAAYEPIAGHVMLVEGPGITGADLSKLTFDRVRRPIWPIDAEAEWSGSAGD